MEKVLISDDNDVTESTTLAEDLGMDSLDKAELMVACDAEFDIDMRSDEDETWVTVGDLVNTIDEYVNQK